MIKLIVCDFDDTLALEYDFIASGYRVCSNYIASKIQSYSKTEIEGFFWEAFKQSPKNVFNRALQQLGLDNDTDLLNQLINLYRYHTPLLSYQSDVSEFINEIKRRNIHSAIITDGNAKTQLNKLKETGAFNDFEKIIITSEWSTNWTKPSTLPFTYLKNYFDVDFTEMLYVGDNPKKDFAAKVNIPIYTARIIRPKAIYTNAEYLKEIREDFTIKNLPEIFNLNLF